MEKKIKKTNWNRIILFTLILFTYYFLMAHGGNIPESFIGNFFGKVIFYPLIIIPYISLPLTILEIILWIYFIAFILEKIISKLVNKK